jgi:hypothetical protein
VTGAPFDLEAAAATARGEAWAFTYRGRSFEVGGDIPLDVLDGYSRFAAEQLEAEGTADPEQAGLRQAAAMRPILEALEGLFTSAEDYAAFRALRPGQSELAALLGEVTRRATGGATLGEASAPSGSSDDGSASARPISAVTTG